MQSSSLLLWSGLFAFGPQMPFKQNKCRSQGHDHQNEREQPAPVLSRMAQHADNVAAIELRKKSDGGIAQGASYENDPQKFGRPNH